MSDLLALDHASFRARSFDEMLERMANRYGLEWTRTPEAPSSHARLYLDRGYLELNARFGKQPVPPSGWAMPFYFLRYGELAPLLERLRAAGLEPNQSEHVGADGRWMDVEVSAPEGVPAPLLTRRTHPPERAADWPPPLSRPQPCGAFALGAVHMRVARLQPALDFFRRLLGVESLPAPAADGHFGGERAELSLPGGHLVLHALEGASPGLMGVALAVSSLRQTAEALKRRGAPLLDGGPELWIDPDETGGLRFGFQER